MAVFVASLIFMSKITDAGAIRCSTIVGSEHKTKNAFQRQTLQHTSTHFKSQKSFITLAPGVIKEITMAQLSLVPQCFIHSYYYNDSLDIGPVNTLAYCYQIVLQIELNKKCQLSKCYLIKRRGTAAHVCIDEVENCDNLFFPFKFKNSISI